MTVSFFFDTGLFYVYSNVWGTPELVTVRSFFYFEDAFNYSRDLLHSIKNDHAKNSPF
jgi:hypothetical protein